VPRLVYECFVTERLTELDCDARCIKVRVPEEHARVAVAGNERDLGQGESALEETRDGFMTQIVEPKVAKTGFLLQSLP
jgi:hypothetical protein